MNVSGVLVQTRPEEVETVIQRLKDSNICDVYTHDELGRIVVTIEGEGIDEEIEKLKVEVKNGLNPKLVKEALAIEIVDRFHGSGTGGLARDEFTKIFAKKDIPTDMKIFHLESGISILQALVICELVPSISQAKRDLKGGAVKIDQVKIDDDTITLEVGKFVLQKGKKNFVKMVVK